MIRLSRADWLCIGDQLAKGLAPLLPPSTRMVTGARAVWIGSPEAMALVSRGFMIIPTPRSFQIRVLTRSAIEDVLRWITKEQGDDWPWAAAAVTVRTSTIAEGTTVDIQIKGRTDDLTFDFVL